MTTTAYIIANDEIIAKVSTDLKNGAEVEYAYNSTKEAINANREVNLVNAKWGKISRAKKWASQDFDCDTAKEVNPSEFLIQ